MVTYPEIRVKMRDFPSEAFFYYLFISLHAGVKVNRCARKDAGLTSQDTVKKPKSSFCILLRPKQHVYYIAVK